MNDLVVFGREEGRRGHDQRPFLTCNKKATRTHLCKRTMRMVVFYAGAAGEKRWCLLKEKWGKSSKRKRKAFVLR